MFLVIARMLSDYRLLLNFTRRIMLTYADVCRMIAQVRLKVAIEFHEADSRDLHKQIDALSTSSETSSVTSGFSSREHHMDIEVRA